MPDEPLGLMFDPGPPREPIEHPDLDPFEVADIIEYLAKAGVKTDDGGPGGDAHG